MRIERQMIRGAGPVAALYLLSRGEMYDYELVEALDRESGGVLAMGPSTLYPMLTTSGRRAWCARGWRMPAGGHGGTTG